MSYDSALDKQLRLLSESRKFHAAYKPALANLQEKEAHITFALDKLAVAKRTLQTAHPMSAASVRSRSAADCLIRSAVDMM